MKKKTLLLVAAVLIYTANVFGQHVVDFEELSLTPDSYWNGSDNSGNFSSKFLTFYNYFETTTYGDYWEGWAYSNMTDTITPGDVNQFSSAAGKGVDGSNNYAVAYAGFYAPTFLKVNYSVGFPNNFGMYISLSTYTSLYMESPNYLGEVFQDENRWLKLHITGLNTQDANINISQEYYLADYRSEIAQPFKITDWTFIDMSWARNCDSLLFSFSSNDTAGGWGINTPTYFCMDNFGAINLGEIPTISPVYTVSGTITFDGDGLADVIVSCSDCLTPTETSDQNGYYEFEVKKGASVTIEPITSVFNFEPNDTIINNILQNIANVDFIATAIPITTYYNVSGTVTHEGIGLEGVTISYSFDGTVKSTVSTNADGEYTINVIKGSNITIEPSFAGYEFDHNDTTFNNITEDIINVDFIATALISVKENIFGTLQIFNNAEYCVISNANNISKVEIFDVLGKIVKTKNVYANSTEINISDLKQGIYLVNVYSENQRVTKKIVK